VLEYQAGEGWPLPLTEIFSYLAFAKDSGTLPPTWPRPRYDGGLVLGTYLKTET